MRVLLDCDGVLADFLQPCLDIINRHMTKILRADDGAIVYGAAGEPSLWSEPKTLADMTHWNIFDALGVPKAVKSLVYKEMKQPGWCETAIKPLPGAQEGVQMLRDCGHQITIVTSPMDGPTWTHERENWLHRHFDVRRRDVIHTEQKAIVHGAMLVDDKPEHVEAWKGHWSSLGHDGVGVLWDYVTNAHVKSLPEKPSWLDLHTSQWTHLLDELDVAAKGRTR